MKRLPLFPRLGSRPGARLACVLALSFGLSLGGDPTQAATPDPGGLRLSYTHDDRQLAPLSVDFRATVPPGYALNWNFGDGSVTTGAAPTHVFYRPGRYSVQVRVTDAQGHTVATSTNTVEARSAGAEHADLTLLLAPGSVRLSAVGSVAYAPGPARYFVDGREVALSRSGRPVKSEPVAVGPGLHRARVELPGQSGVLRRDLTFRMAALTPSVPFDTEVLRLTNAARQSGWNCQTLRPGGPARPPLTRDPTLDAAATAQSAGLALGNAFEHRSSLDGSQPYGRVAATGLEVSRVGENIAMGQDTPQQVVDEWLRSPGHCHNIMGDFTHIGLSFLSAPASAHRTYWTQVFAAR